MPISLPDPEVQAQAKVPLKDAAHVSSIKTVVVDQLAEQFGSAQVVVTYGYETKYKRIQVLGLAKSHANDAVAIACEIGEMAAGPPNARLSDHSSCFTHHHSKGGRRFLSRLKPGVHALHYHGTRKIRSSQPQE